MSTDYETSIAECDEHWRKENGRSESSMESQRHERNGDGKPHHRNRQFVHPIRSGHVHLHEIGQTVKKEIEKLGCFAAEFNTIAIDDGIAMGHDGMLYSLPSRDLIADSVEYMVNAHKADAMICISNCDKITPGMLMAAMRLNIPTIFVSGGPMEAGQLDGKGLDLIDAMVESADETISDEQVRRVEHAACPTCGSCSGMFTANSMNCLNEAIGLALPGNGTVVATHRNRERLFIQAARQIVENCRAYYQDGDESVLPRNIATRAAFLNAMTLDIAMGGSTNTVLHLLAIAQEAGVDFTIQDIDSLSRKSPVLCKVAPNSHYHIQDVNRAGGILSILAILEKEGLIDASVRRVDRLSLTEAIEQYAIRNGTCSPEAERLWKSAPGNRFNLVMGSQENYYDKLDTDRSKGCIRDFEHAYVKDGGLAVLFGNIAQDGCIVKTAGVDETHFPLQGKSQSIRIAGRGLRRHTRRESRERRRGRHHLRRPQRRPRHARDALPYLVYQIETPRQSLCPHYRRAFLRWDIRDFPSDISRPKQPPAET